MTIINMTIFTIWFTLMSYCIFWSPHYTIFTEIIIMAYVYIIVGTMLYTTI